ncbi:MAG: hypothetical protein WDZ35_10960 [Crocinitomicaceae bacterium]
MNKTFLLLVGVLSSLLVYSQNFQASNTYHITGINYEYRMGYYEDSSDTLLHAYLVLSNDTTNQLIEYSLPDIDTYDSVYVREWIMPGYKNVDRILWVQFEYMSGCFDYEVYYYIITKRGKLVPFPAIYYSMCDYPGDIEEFMFDPKKGTFQHVINTYLDKDTIEKTTELETLFWNGKTIQTSE